MRILVFAFIFLLFLVQLFFASSYAQTTGSSSIGLTPKIFFYFQLYDKDGHLYGYVQPHLQIFDQDRTIAWVAHQATNSSVVYQGHNYLLMKFQDSMSGDKFEQFGGYFLNVPINGVDTNIFYAYHDSYLMDKGDSGKVFWEILVPSR